MDTLKCKKSGIPIVSRSDKMYQNLPFLCWLKYGLPQKKPHILPTLVNLTSEHDFFNPEHQLWHLKD